MTGLNPLNRLWIFMVIILGLFTTSSLKIILPVFLLLGIFVVKAPETVWQRVKGFLLFLPVLAGLYVLIAVWLSNLHIVIALSQAGLAVIKLFILVSGMAVYLEWGEGDRLITAFRSLWAKTGLAWRWVEYFLLFLGLVLRFYPAYQEMWTNLKSSDKALGMADSRTLKNNVQSLIKFLPGMLLDQYRHADEISQLMVMRGFGSVFPRTVAFPLQWTVKDSLVFVGVPVLILGVRQLAAL